MDSTTMSFLMEMIKDIKEDIKQINDSVNDLEHKIDTLESSLTKHITDEEAMLKVLKSWDGKDRRQKDGGKLEYLLKGIKYLGWGLGVGVAFVVMKILGL